MVEQLPTEDVVEPSGAFDIDQFIAEEIAKSTPPKEIAKLTLLKDPATSAQSLASKLGLKIQDINLEKAHIAKMGKPAPPAAGGGRPTEETKFKQIAEGVSPDYSPAIAEFAAAIDEVLPEKIPVSWKKHVIKLYERQPPNTRQSRQQLEYFLFRHGFTALQVAGVVDTILPSLSDGQFSGQFPGQFPSGQPIMAINPQTGQQMPVIVIGQQGQGAGQSPGPMIINPPSSQPGLSEEKVQLMIRDAIAEAVREVRAAQPPPPPPAPSPSIPYRRMPMLDNDGNIMKDASGQVIHQEIPYDPSMTMLEFLRPVLMQKPAPAPPPVDEEKVRLQNKEMFTTMLKETLPKESPKPEIDTEKLAMQIGQQIDNKYAPTIQALQAESAARSRQAELEAAVQRATAPLIAEIQAVKANQGLTLDERKIHHLTDTVKEVVRDVKGDARFAISQSLLPQYAQMEKQLNLSEGTLTGPLLEGLGANKRQPPIPSAGDASRVLAAVEGWSKS